MNNLSKIVLGLDGLDKGTAQDYDFPFEPKIMPIVTVPHTHHSWYAIFSGEKTQYPEWWHWPEEEPEYDTVISEASDRMLDEEDVDTDKFIWNKFEYVDVVSVPIVINPSITDYDVKPKYSMPNCQEELIEGIDVFREHIFDCENCVVVLPHPDKVNHICDDPEREVDKDLVLGKTRDLVEDILNEFDEWIALSDHGKPAPRVYVSPHIYVPAHTKFGVVASNVFDVSDETNLSIYSKICELFDE